MAEIGKQRWVTYASGDVEGVKALLLARSLRRVITTRSSIVFVSNGISEDICELLQNEYDTCIRIGKKQIDLYSGQRFSAIVKAKCFGLTKLAKFVFLDCNCVVLKNSDELFKKIGCGLVPSGSEGEVTACVIAGRPVNRVADAKAMSELKMQASFAKACQQHDGTFWGEGEELIRLDNKYSVSVDLKRIGLLNGTDMHIACFTGAHPLDGLLNHKTNGKNGHNIGVLEQGLLEYCMDLFATDGLKEKVAELFQNSEALKILTAQKNGNGIHNTIRTDMHLESIKDSVAIVGMSFRFPGANNVDEFWDLLVNGKDGIVKVPEGRWSKDQCFIRGDNTRDTLAGFLKCPVDKIDGKFFGMTPAELSYMDPQQRLALQVVWEGLEHAGINPLTLKNTNAGVFGGWWRNDYKEMLQEAGLNETEFFRAYMGNALGTMTSRISHCLELTGPSISTESGCSTSIVSVDMACNSLRNESCDVGLAVGVNLLLHPFSIDAMNAVVAMDGHCKTFDAKADGFGRAEGCAVLVLKRFADAVKSGDRIWGLIRGSAVVQEGPSRSLGTPTKHCEALAMQLALDRAGVEPKDVSFVETHGTGTPVGDPLEIAAMAEVYSKGRKQPLTIGSVKTNIGHTESVSGIAGIVKTILSLQNEIIPPHLNLETLNPEINLETIPAVIPMTAQSWMKDPLGKLGKPRIAGVSSFGITGTDAHVIIQETPEYKSSGLPIYDSRPLQVLTISAKSEEGLDDLILTYKKFLEETKEDLLNISYTSNIGRGHFQHRFVVIGTDNSEILQKLDKHAFEMKQFSGEIPKICFLFTGQGSQYPGMAKTLYESSPVFKSHFDRSDKILRTNFGISLKSVIWGPQANDLNRTLFSQTSIFCIEFCLLKLWESWGVKPDFVLGHSLGEYSAAVAAGILTFEHALKLVVERSRLIDGLPGGQMLVVREPLENVEIQLKSVFNESGKFLDIAAVNSPDQTVVAGSSDCIQEFMNYCKVNSIEARKLEATHAFHSNHMDPILDEYQDITSTVAYQDPKNCIYVSGMEGCIIDACTKISKDYWVKHTRDRVRFIDAIKTVLDSECTHFIEIGPHPVLSGLTLINASTMDFVSPISCLPSIRRNQNDWETMLSSLSKLYTSGFDINWENFHRYSSPKKVDLPYYPFQEKSYWMEVKDDGSIPIHPLVGCSLPNPSSLKLFRGNVDVYRTTFLKDHVIGNRVIFPGAGFMEMCLVGGHAAVQCTEGGYFSPVSPISIENFLIEAPLCLSETGRNQLQTVLSSEDSGETRATVYSKLTLDKDTHKWIRHASGTFSPFALKWDGEDSPSRGTLEDIKARCNEKLVTDQTYSKLEEFGLKFGPTFQTLRSAWKGNDEMFFEIEVTDDPKRFVCHPVIIDAMFQAIMIGTYSDAENKLHVPISVSKFIWYAKIETDTCYIYSRKPEDPTGDVTVLLYDSNGKLLAVMVGAEFLETTVTSIMSLLEAQRMPFPSMFEDVWRDQLGPLERRIPPEVCSGSREQIFSPNFGDSYKVYNIFDQDEQIFFDKSNHLYLLYMLNALKKLGWNATPGNTVELNTLTEYLKVQPSIKGLLRYILLVLVEEGYLSVLDWNRDNMSFKVVKQLPMDGGAILNDIESLYVDLNPEINLDIKCVSATGNVLAEILKGVQSPLPILFPEDSNAKGPAELFYYESKMKKNNFKIVGSVCNLVLNELKAHLKDTKNVLRILEVGAGTGSFTEDFIKGLDGNPTNYEYSYTDVSPVFFSKGEKIFENNKMKVNYKVLNIEEDPASQGFIPHHYDIVIASFVIHATRNMRESVSNLRNLLRPRGLLLVTELTKPYRAINLLFGALEGFWRFNDYDIRPYNCEMGTKKWEQVLKKLDFDNTASFPSFNGHSAFIIAAASEKSTYVTQYQTPSLVQKSWVVFTEEGQVCDSIVDKLSQLGKTVILIKRSSGGFKHIDGNYYIRGNEPTDMVTVFETENQQKNKELEGVIYLWGLDYQNETDYTSVCRPFLTLSKIFGSYDHKKLLVFTRGLLNVGDHLINLPSASPLIGMTKALQNENSALSCRCIDLDPSSTDPIASLQEGLTELLTGDGETIVAYRGGQRLVSRFITLKVPNTALPLPKSEAFHLILPPTNSLSDLRFGPMDRRPSLEDSRVEIRVVSYALNFKDLLTVLKPEVMFEKMSTMGIDYAGVVTAIGSKVTAHKIGDPVIGANLDSFGEALPSHQYSDEDMLIPIPDWMTYCEGSTLPAVAATAYICLVEVAKINENDTVLIHTGSGGVGLCAIQIAQSKKCKIIATAGSERKRKFLRNLGIQHVFHSRNTNYEKDIRTALGGQGVDVVLNSLTSPGFKEATLSVCNQGARFIEMSKLSVWSNEEVYALRPDVKYEIVDLLDPEKSKIRENMQKIKKFVKESTIKPIPYVRFDASEIRDALTYLQKAKHIGKIVCVMPERSVQNGSSEFKTALFNDRSSYLITGGLGGIGMEVAKWMISSGAKHIVLVGRNSPKEKALEDIKKMSLQGCNVIVKECDVGDFEKCKELLDALKSEDLHLPQLRGIFHAAGVLSDGVLANQTWEKYETAFNAKVKGGWNLHKLTLDYPLEQFVMFSSAASNFGSFAQSNHAAANTYLDCLAFYRYGIGLPSMTVNWGQWGQVGVAAELDLVAFRPFTVLQGVSALEKAMKSNRLQTSVVEADFNIVKKAFAGSKKYLEELKMNQNEKVSDIGINADQFWKEYDSSENRQEKYEVVRKFIHVVIRHTLKMDQDETIDDNSNFQDMGMDSLMMIEMKNSLQISMGKRVKITVNSVRDCKNVCELSHRLVELISGEEELPPPTREELTQWIREDSELDAAIKPAEGNVIKPSEIRTVLITGVTGNFGPYILREISKRSQFEKIYCLIRDPRIVTPKERLKQILTDKNMISEIRMEDIECLTGDVAKPNLGLSQEIYNELAEKVDAVFHLSVKAAVDELYRKIEDPTKLENIRTANVTGTVNVLQFVCSKKPKQLYHASTTIATSKLDSDERLWESWPLLDEFDNRPNSGYPISKFICDRLISQAVSRGVSSKVFRFPCMGGDSVIGGNISVLGNHLLLRMMAYLYLGKIPAQNVPLMIVPVDICAELSMSIFLNDELESDIFNVSNPFVDDELQIDDIAEDFGYSVEAVEPDEFIEIVSKIEGGSEIIDLVKRATSRTGDREEMEDNIPELYEAWLRNKKGDVFLSKKLVQLVPELYPRCMESSISLLKKDLQFAKDSGAFEKVGLKK